MNIIKGRIWKFGDNISTDLLLPGSTMYGKVPREEMPRYCLQAVRPEFAGTVKTGDIIVAGKNFGCGGARPATSNLISLGVGCVVTESTAGIFFRNSISLGFLIIICSGITDFFQDGQNGEVHLEEGIIVNLNSGQKIKFKPYPPFLLEILQKGGILEVWKNGKRLSENN